MRAGKVEGAGRERERRAVSLDELGIRLRACPRELEQLGDGIEADDLPHQRREREGERTGSGADVEGALVAARLDEVAHRCREPLRARILQRRDAIRRTSEAVSRQRRGGRGSGRS